MNKDKVQSVNYVFLSHQVLSQPAVMCQKHILLLFSNTVIKTINAMEHIILHKSLLTVIWYFYLVLTSTTFW